MNAPSHRSLWVLPWLAAAVPFACVALRGFPAGDDWQLELARVAAYAHAWADGQWPPFWAPQLYAGYGSLIFLFYGHVFLSLASLCALATGSYAAGFLTALALVSACGVWLLQLAAAALIEPASDAGAGRVAAMLFMVHPYAFADLMLRNAAAEYTGLCLLPLALLGLMAIDRDPRRGGALLALGAGLVLAAHGLVAFAGCIALAPLALRSGTRARVATIAAALGGALALAAYQWLPVLSYGDQIRSGDLLTGKFDFRTQFLPFAALFDLAHPYAIGPLPLMAAGAAAFVAIRGPGPTRALLLSFAVLLLLQTRLSLPLWDHVPGLPYFQFPWRFTGPLALVSALLGGCTFAELARSWSARRRMRVEVLVFCAGLMSILPQLARMQGIDRARLAAFEGMLEPNTMSRLLMTSTVSDEYLPRTARRDAITHPASDEPVVSGTPGLRIAIRRVEPRALAFDVATPPAADGGELCLARWGFPLWQTRVDDRPQPAGTCAAGQLRVQFAQGKHRLTASLPMPSARRLGLVISALTCLALAAAFALPRRRRARTNASDVAPL